MYAIEFSEYAKKQFSKLENVVQDRILKCLERIRVRPYSHVKKLVGDGSYSLRVGDYRVIMDIYEDKLLILVIMVGHRSNIYSKF